MALDLCYERTEDIQEVKINDKVICAYYVPNEPFFELEHGSPLISRNSSELVGITSWHKEDYPKVFTRVRTYVDWIRSIISE